jgi:hypothetical protein
MRSNRPSILDLEGSMVTGARGATVQTGGHADSRKPFWSTDVGPAGSPDLRVKIRRCQERKTCLERRQGTSLVTPT